MVHMILANQVGYIIVIARLPGIYGDVNRPCSRATPSDSDRFTAINPWPRAITIIHILGHLLVVRMSTKHMPVCMHYALSRHP